MPAWQFWTRGDYVDTSGRMEHSFRKAAEENRAREAAIDTQEVAVARLGRILSGKMGLPFLGTRRGLPVYAGFEIAPARTARRKISSWWEDHGFSVCGQNSTGWSVWVAGEAGLANLELLRVRPARPVELSKAAPQVVSPLPVEKPELPAAVKVELPAVGQPSGEQMLALLEKFGRRA